MRYLTLKHDPPRTHRREQMGFAISGVSATLITKRVDVAYGVLFKVRREERFCNIVFPGRSEFVKGTGL
jgi:hypothetical protein